MSLQGWYPFNQSSQPKQTVSFIVNVANRTKIVLYALMDYVGPQLPL